MALKQTAASSSGVATIDRVAQNADRIQVGIAGESGTGTITLTVRTPCSGQAFRSVVDGTIDVSDPQDVYIIGKVNAVKATSSESGDSFELVVVG